MQFEIEIQPVGWREPTRFDVVVIDENQKRIYMGYACCLGHAKLAVELITVNQALCTQAD